MKVKKGGIIWLVLAILNVIVFLFDKPIIFFITKLRTSILDILLFNFAFDNFVIILLALLIGILILGGCGTKKRCLILSAIASVVFSWIIGSILCNLIMRPGPFQEYPIPVLTLLFINLSGKIIGYHCSFPCIHAMITFSLIPLLNEHFKKLRVLWIILASIISLSRVYFGANYLSDVFAGALLGYLIGYLVLKINEKYEISEKIRHKIMHK
ncbi:MAG: phosphatase PAP2 family protein [Candidatus Pacearchaeota archaeon]